MRFRGFDRFIRPYLATMTDDPFEVDARPFANRKTGCIRGGATVGGTELPNQENSTKGISFRGIRAMLYIDGRAEARRCRAPGPVHRRPKDGKVGVDRLFRYDRMDDDGGLHREPDGVRDPADPAATPLRRAPGWAAGCPALNARTCSRRWRETTRSMKALAAEQPGRPGLTKMLGKNARECRCLYDLVTITGENRGGRSGE